MELRDNNTVIAPDLTLCEFIANSGFDVDRYAIPLQFWFDLHEKSDDEWFVLTDDLINLIGFKSSVSNISHNRSNLLKFIRKHFTENVDFLVTTIGVAKKTRGGAHHRIDISMKKRPFQEMLLSVRTDTSKLLHRYFIDFENLCKDYILYQKDQENKRLRAAPAIPVLDECRRAALLPSTIQRKVYIFTSENYARNNIYKIGITGNIKKRKSNLNTSHAFVEEDVYEAYSVFCYDAEMAEKSIHNALELYRYRSDREFFHVPFIVARRVVDLFVRSFNKAHEELTDVMEQWDRPSDAVPAITAAPQRLENDIQIEANLLKRFCSEVEFLADMYDNMYKSDYTEIRTETLLRMQSLSDIIPLLNPAHRDALMHSFSALQRCTTEVFGEPHRDTTRGAHSPPNDWKYKFAISLVRVNDASMYLYLSV